MSDFVMTIGGDTVPAAESFGVINPATGEVFAEAPECTRAAARRRLRGGRQGAAGLEARRGARRATLLKMADVLMASGRGAGPDPHRRAGQAAGPGEHRGASARRSGASTSPTSRRPPQVIQDDASACVEVVRRPLGVVAAITPWNFPLILAFWKIAPALLAGNTLVLKPSPFTPLSTLKVGRAASRRGPARRLQRGQRRRRARRVDDRRTRCPARSASRGRSRRARRSRMSAAPDLKRVTLELGGNDAAIVLDDADPAAVGKGIFAGAFANNGQVCSAVKRVYVPEALYDEVVGALRRRGGRGPRWARAPRPACSSGRSTTSPSSTRVKELVADALAGGATAATGGAAMDRPGYFFEPTILTGLIDGTRIVDEEQFGPALPVISYRDVDDAVERANATHFGLSGSVWGADAERAAGIAGRLECGTAWVNTHLALSPSSRSAASSGAASASRTARGGSRSSPRSRSVHRSKSADGLNLNTGGLVS